MIYRFVCIEGNIGAGKTTLAKLLAEEFGGSIILEKFDDNPYLSKFYEEPEKFALQLEVSFLLERYQQLNRILSEPNIFSNFSVTDYMFEKCLLFAKINLNKTDYQLYRHFFHLVSKKIPKPDIIFYLHADPTQLAKNIKERGRSYEQGISKVYLNRIERMYFEYFKQNHDFKVVVVYVNNIDWVSNAFAYKQLLGLFDKEYKNGINFVNLHD